MSLQVLEGLCEDSLCKDSYNILTLNLVKYYSRPLCFGDTECQSNCSYLTVIYYINIIIIPKGKANIH